MVGPFLGPALAGYIGAGTNWRDSFGVLTAIFGLSTLMVLVFGAETYYNPGKAPTSRVGSYFGFGNTNLPKGSTLWHWCKVMVLYVFQFPLLMTGIAILVTFTWPIGKCFQQGGINCLQWDAFADTRTTGITTTIDGFLHSPPYNFDTIEASSMRFAGVIGALGGKLPRQLVNLSLPLFGTNAFSPGWLVGFIFNNWIYKRHYANWWTEYRLHGVWFPLVSMVSGLLTYGLTMNFGKHWIGIAFGWIMVNIGMVGTVV